MMMPQATRSPALPVGSVLSDIPSMNSWHGSSSTILPGFEEAIDGQRCFRRIQRKMQPSIHLSGSPFNRKPRTAKSHLFCSATGRRL